MEARLKPSRLRPERELEAFIRRLSGDGAVVSFVGIARPTGRDGEPVIGLHLDHYPGMTEASLAEIAADALKRFEVSDVAVVHRCGHVSPGDPIVFAAAAAPHRRSAFLAADYLMDRLKTDAVFWKREDGVDGSRWIEPTEGDHTDRDRWREPSAGDR
ncbi:molybdenum cofactor biosynthesis protein MoaE [Sphingosinicella humi]|uniref:Molybdopterin synthase catalytic subunit n=1 Tax=Allosphingosinicella humi TaxID=2068657 RepID=A0A2U2J0D2_9SPHN|nr:molybdenum cofactor biosynthesis protein MoaE [Sphingosinicella humi]PWG01741.1 molybdopterin synthase [Sphingosinicella humi]